MQHNPGIVAMQHQPGFTDASVQFLLESMAWTPAGAHLGATGRSGKACRAQVRSYETGGRGETIRSPVPRLTRGSGRAADRSGGEEWVRTCSSRWSTWLSKKKNN